MIGTAIGDIIGSPYELNTILEVTDPNWEPLFQESLSKYTDDTVLTMATADAIVNEKDFHIAYRDWARRYPNKGYGGTFWAWANQDLEIKNKSYADGCMMRCSPIGIFWSHDLDYALVKAKESIEWTHNSPESLRGVSAIVAAIVMSFQGKTKAQIRAYVEEQFGIWLNASVQEIKETWDTRNIRCNITCAQALTCFLTSQDFETAIRLAVYSGGDCDTIAAICGSLAEAFYGPQSIPRWMIDEAKKRMSPEMIELTNTFYECVNEVNPKSPYKGFII